jgi:hypothetical protein
MYPAGHTTGCMTRPRIGTQRPQRFRKYPGGHCALAVALSAITASAGTITRAPRTPLNIIMDAPPSSLYERGKAPLHPPPAKRRYHAPPATKRVSRVTSSREHPRDRNARLTAMARDGGHAPRASRLV